MFLLKDSDWEVKKTKEKGYGVFSKKEIRSGTVISDYLGKIINISEYDLNNDKKGLYLMYLTDQTCVYPNLTKPGPHLLNHSCKPNCWVYIYNSHTLFFALRKIKPGEELTISYLLSPKDDTCDPCNHDCKCESKFCTGTMHLSKDKYEKWQKFQNNENKKNRTTKFVFGKDMLKLDYYPKTVPNNEIYKKIHS